MMDWNCAGFSRPESRRYSSSVRIVLRERFAAAGSTPIFFGLLFVSLVGWSVGDVMDEEEWWLWNDRYL